MGLLVNGPEALCVLDDNCHMFVVINMSLKRCLRVPRSRDLERLASLTNIVKWLS